MATIIPGQPSKRRNVEPADVAKLTRDEVRLADEVLAFLLRHEIGRREITSILHLAISLNEITGRKQGGAE